MAPTAAAMLESKGETGTQGCMLKLASDRGFHLWHQWEHGEITRSALAKRTKLTQAMKASLTGVPIPAFQA